MGLLFALSAATASRAADICWSDGNGDWNTAGNWHTGTVPSGAADHAQVMKGAGTSANITAGTPAVHWASVSGGGNGADGNGVGARGEYNFTGEQLTVTGNSYIGRQSGSVADFNLNDTRPYSGAGSDVVQLQSNLTVGENSGATGNVNIRGANMWVFGTPIVGDTGQGNLTLNDSLSVSLIETGNTLVVGNANGRVGTVTHSATTDAQMWVGQLILGNQAGSTGTCNMSGASTLQGQGGPGTAIPSGIHVGDSGTGNLNISGGTVYNQNNRLWLGVSNGGGGNGQALQVYVPEPGTIAVWSLVGLAAGGYLLRRRTRRA